MNEEFLEELRRVLNYNPDTGVMTWKFAVGNRIKAGSPAGYVSQGRLRITFRGDYYYAHRLAWLLTYGKWPEKFVDHIDGNPLNNRITNLRDVSHNVNSQNQREARVDNQTGLLGVSPYKKSGKFKATIQVNGKAKHLGYFSTKEEAYMVYLVAKQEFHEGCTI